MNPVGPSSLEPGSTSARPLPFRAGRSLFHEPPQDFGAHLSHRDELRPARRGALLRQPQSRPLVLSQVDQSAHRIVSSQKSTSRKWDSSEEQFANVAKRIWRTGA